MIKILFLILFLIAFRVNSFSQSPAPGSEGEWETNEISKVFSSKNAGEHYPKYHGSFVLKGDSILYSGNGCVRVDDADSKELFILKIFYPDLFWKAPGSDTKALKISLQPVEQQPYHLTTSTDSAKIRIYLNRISIGGLEELKSLETNKTQRRFRFLLFTEASLNPTLYVAELTNKRANADTDEMTFFKGAKLTLLREVSILI